ncbi:MAG: hypothetical protein ABSF69_30345, partial [Polyangiaceae bacterium]
SFRRASVHSRTPRACRARARLHLDSVEQRFERRVVDLHVGTPCMTPVLPRLPGRREAIRHDSDGIEVG